MLRNSKCDPPDVIIARPIQWWHNFMSINEVKISYFPSHHFPAKWCVPPSGCLKLNIDDSWNCDKSLGGFGLIVGTSGDFVAAKCGKFFYVFSPLQLEAMVVRIGLIWETFWLICHLSGN